jgi:hypothetical protein
VQGGYWVANADVNHKLQEGTDVRFQVTRRAAAPIAVVHVFRRPRCHCDGCINRCRRSSGSLWGVR